MNIKQKIILAMYYLFFRKLPYQPIPGYKIRSWCARKLFKKCGTNIVIKNMAYHKYKAPDIPVMFQGGGSTAACCDW